MLTVFGLYTVRQKNLPLRKTALKTIKGASQQVE
jgi:hypothetical protein